MFNELELKHVGFRYQISEVFLALSVCLSLEWYNWKAFLAIIAFY